MKYSVVIPCYNEEKNLDRLISRMDDVRRSAVESGGEMELVLVDNGSRDNSHDKIQSFMRERDWVREARVQVNQGYGYGILQGLAACTGDFLFWLHADLQLPPEAVLKMIDILDSSKDPERVFFKGGRKDRPLTDRFFTWGMGMFESMYLGVHLRDINGQPTGFSRAFYEAWVDPPYDFSLDLYAYATAVKKGLRIERVEVIQSERTEGASSWNTGMMSRFKLIRRTIQYSRSLKKSMKG